jgi:hypothetical protein
MGRVIAKQQELKNKNINEYERITDAMNTNKLYWKPALKFFIGIFDEIVDSIVFGI